MNARGLGLHRKLTEHGGNGIAFGDGRLTQDEAAGTFGSALTTAEKRSCVAL